MKGRVLVIDDDEASCELVRAIFAPQGVDVFTAHDAREGRAAAVRDRPDVVLLDLHLPDADGLSVLESLQAADAQLPVIVVTASRDVRPAIEATKLGAFDYLTKPIEPDDIIAPVRRALEARALRREVEELRRGAPPSNLAHLMGPSERVRQLDTQVNLVAASTFTVLILGETGTGKELIAQAIFERSDRRSRSYVALDCGAIPEALIESELFGHERGAFTGAERRREGRFRVADGGTCFLDEIGNLPMNLQVKLLRVLESREVQAVGAEQTTSVDIRFVAATNRDLKARAAQGDFRDDLYYRLAQYVIDVPSLRERPDDIAYLAHRFFEEVRIELRRPAEGIVPDALALLRGHPWPGNVRELRNVIRNAVLHTTGLAVTVAAVKAALGGAAAEASVPVPAPTGASLKEIANRAAGAAERLAIVNALRASGGNKTRAARALQTDFKTLHVKIKQLGITPDDLRS
jgi:DNA-binding NtrC family response regulator